MSDPEEKKELGGLARSIDSLFSSPASDPSPPEEAEPAADFPVPVPLPEDLTLGSSAIDTGPAFPEAEAWTDFSDDTGVEAPEEATGPSDVPPEASLVEVSPEATPDQAENPLEVAEPSGPSEPPPAAEGTEDTAAAEALAESATERDGDGPSEDTAEEADEPSPLDLAVEAYISGDGDATRVRALAKQRASQRDYDPLARALVRLVELAYGEDSEAMELARELLTPMVRGRLIQQIGAEHDPAARQRYYDVCTKLGVEMAEAIRDGLAEAPDRFARRAYFDALVSMGEIARPVIEAMAEDENRFHARNAVAILGEIGGERAIRLIEGALANTDAKVRREAILGLARLGSKTSDEIIVGRLVDDTDETVRRAAVVAVGELRIARGLRPLIEMLEKSYEPDEVLPLLQALGQLADPGAVPAIEKHAVRDMFGKPRTNVRIAAYQALHHIGTPHARRLLNKAVSDKDPEVKAVVKGLLHMR